MTGSRRVSSGPVEVGLSQQLSSIVTVYLGVLKPQSLPPHLHPSFTLNRAGNSSAGRSSTGQDFLPRCAASFCQLGNMTASPASSQGFADWDFGGAWWIIMGFPRQSYHAKFHAG